MSCGNMHNNMQFLHIQCEPPVQAAIEEMRRATDKMRLAEEKVVFLLFNFGITKAFLPYHKGWLFFQFEGRDLLRHYPFGLPLNFCSILDTFS